MVVVVAEAMLAALVAEAAAATAALATAGATQELQTRVQAEAGLLGLTSAT